MQEPTTVDQGVVPSRFHSHLHRPTAKTLLFVSVALAVYVFLIMVVMNFSLVKFAFATHGDRFETVEGGVPTWYKSEFGMIRKVAGPEGFKNAPVTVLEAIPYGATPNEFAVLAKVEGVEGIALGILHANNTFENILADGTNKADLAVRPDGTALYAAMVDGESRLMLLDLTKSGVAPSDLGRGRSPRVFTDGFFVAISSRGIVRVDPVTKSVTVLMPSTDADIYNGTISRDGLAAAISNTSGKTLLYAIRHTNPGNVSLVSTSQFVALSPLSFVDEEFIIEPSTRLVNVYEKLLSLKKIGSFRIK